MENVTCNRLLLHSAGQVIDFQRNHILLGNNREELPLTAVKSCPVRLWLRLGRFSEAWCMERWLILSLVVTEIQVPPALGDVLTGAAWSCLQR